MTSNPAETWCVSAATAEPCTSPYTTPPLPDGFQSITVQLLDGSARSEVALTVDTVEPRISISDEPAGGGRHTVGFVANEPASFQCALDGAAFASCTSPFTTPTLPILTPHTFRLRAIDQAGWIDIVTVDFTVL